MNRRAIKFLVFVTAAVLVIEAALSSLSAFAKTDSTPQDSSAASSSSSKEKDPAPKKDETAVTTESSLSAASLAATGPLSEGGVGQGGSLSPLLSDSFHTDLATGAATINIPIVVPPGRKNMQPNLALSYSSNNPNGTLGVGWSLTSSSIQRSTKKGAPTYGDSRYDSNTKFLSHFDGTEGSTTIIDESHSRHTGTASGNAHLAATNFKFGTASLALDGSGDYLMLPDSDDWNFGTGDFTIDIWVNLSSWYAGDVLIGQSSDNFVWYYWILRISDTNTNNLEFEVWNSVGGSSAVINLEGAHNMSPNSWNHIALIRNGNNFNMYVNGSSIASATDSDSIPNFAGNLYVGGRVGGCDIDGYIDELRVSKGIARWPSDPFPPTEAFSPGYFTAEDTFIFASSGSSGELVKVDAEMGEYRQKIEAGFMRYVYDSASSTWLVWDKNGIKYSFGSHPASRTTDPADSTKIFAWHLDKVTDIYGNYLTYIYETDTSGQTYISKIQYAANDLTAPILAADKSIEFVYEPTRPDILYNNRTGWNIETKRRLKEIQIKVDNALKWKYVIDYAQSRDTGRSLISQITVSDGVNSLPPKKFMYQTLE